MGYTKTDLDMIQLCGLILNDDKAMKGSPTLASGSLTDQKLDQWSDTFTRTEVVNIHHTKSH